MGMRGSTAAMAAALVVAALACSSNNNGGGGGGSGGGGGATNATCQAMRQCVMDCDDTACIDTCKSRGNAAAQAAFQALYECTMDPARGNCPTAASINDCVCMAQCYDGACLAETDACVGGGTDIVCDLSCH